MRISIEEAQNELMSHAELLSIEEIPVADAFGRIAAEDIVSNMTQPPFARSSMDGYAVRRKDVSDCKEESPVKLPVCAVCFAGDAPAVLLPGCAVRIMTGAPVPAEADMVIPQELTDCGEDDVIIKSIKLKNNNVVPAGEDFSEGDILLQNGRTIDAYTVAASVAGAVEQVKVRRKIKAAVITTGSELVSPGEKLAPGQIYNSSLAFFETRLKALGCDVVKTVSVTDDPKQIQKLLEETSEDADLILTTGGVSVGKKDFIPEVIEKLGAENIFRHMDIKPGAPTMAAKYNGTTILCLSGNPYSAIAMFELLFPSYEMKVLNRKNCRMFSFQTFALNSFPKASPKRRIIRGVFKQNGVYIPEGQRNGQLISGIGSNCLVDLPAGSTAVKEGEMVTVHMLHND